jgi:hypothetical protein
MNDNEANLLREKILEECPLKKKIPTKDEMHSMLSKPFNVEFKGMGLFIEKNLVDDKSLDCIKSKFTDGRNRKIKEVKNGYVIYDPI